MGFLQSFFGGSNASTNKDILDSLRRKHGSIVWDILYNHPEGPAKTAGYALGDLDKIRRTFRNKSIYDYYLISTQNFIKNGNSNDSYDILQSLSKEEIQNIILYCKNDFTLLLFVTLFLSVVQVRDKCSEGLKSIELYIDLIYSTTSSYTILPINPLSLNQKYEDAKSFVAEFM